ncbi:MAG TPA: hypothetical protein VH144_03665 [Candidatus Saccharimonadales bacterium]|jgi:hypothetical protein|nr:hypothetical protein [Candidatus Saccharimonadales bacterium]
MKTLIFYRDLSEHGQPVREFLREFTRQTGKTVEGVDPDSAQGIELCRLYDIVEYPTVVAVDNEGHMQQMWRGLPLPTIMEVSYYVQQN